VSEEPVLWWLTRSAGLMALLLLTVSLVLGVLSTRGSPSGRLLRQGVHRWCSGLSVALVAAHVALAIADPYVPLTLVDTVVPLRAGYRPVWLALGTFGVDLLLAVALTSVLRPWLSGPRWRSVHLLAYAAWPVSVLHGLGAGTDVRAVAVRAVTAGCVAAVLLAVLIQLLREVTVVRLTVLVVLLAGLGAAVGWAVQGPLAPGWSDRAGAAP
jgi:sulfoxide reductase heme-binding subunit YedZ